MFFSKKQHLSFSSPTPKISVAYCFKYLILPDNAEVPDVVLEFKAVDSIVSASGSNALL